METKKPVQSKSIWFNTLSIIALVGGALLADESFRELVGAYSVYLIIAVNVINMIIRGYTDKPLARETKPKDKKLNPLEQALADESEY